MLAAQPSRARLRVWAAATGPPYFPPTAARKAVQSPQCSAPQPRSPSRAAAARYRTQLSHLWDTTTTSVLLTTDRAIWGSSLCLRAAANSKSCDPWGHQGLTLQLL